MEVVVGGRGRGPRRVSGAAGLLALVLLLPAAGVIVRRAVVVVLLLLGWSTCWSSPVNAFCGVVPRSAKWPFWICSV